MILFPLLNSNFIMANLHSKKYSWENIIAAFEEYLYQKGKSTETIIAYGYSLKAFGIFYIKGFFT